MLVADRGHKFPRPQGVLYLFSVLLTSQQNLLRQQERVEERVQEIEEQLCKLDSDKCVVEVCFCTSLRGRVFSFMAL